MRKFLQVIKDAGLVVSKKNMELFKTSINILRNTTSNDQIASQQHAVEFADKFPDKITDKTQLLEVFWKPQSYVSHFYKVCAKDKKILNERLSKNCSTWYDAHTKVVRNIKQKVRNLPILYVVDDELPKIVESDASEAGWGAILKQVRCEGHKDK